MILFWVITRTGLQALKLKKPVYSHSVAALYTQSSFSSCLFKDPPVANTHYPLIGRLTHTWVQLVNNNRAAVLKSVLTCQTSHAVLNYANVWHVNAVMSLNHVIRGGTTDEAFEGQCFLWERGASLGAAFDLFNLLSEH